MSLTCSCGDGGINLGNGMHGKFKTVSDYFCNGLFSIGEDGSEPEEFLAFESYLEDTKFLRRSFTNSDIVHVLKTETI